VIWREGWKANGDRREPACRQAWEHGVL